MMKIIRTLYKNTVEAICGCGKNCIITKTYLSHCKRKKRIPLCKDCQKLRKSENSRKLFDFSKYYLKKYGKLTFTSSFIDETKQSKRKRMFVCMCDCGNQYICCSEIKKDIIKGNTVSCGCHKSENARKMGLSKTVHGHTYRDKNGYYKTPSYKNWDKIINCCRKGWKRQFHKVCHEYDPKWENFEEFLKDFGILKDKQIVARIDNQKSWSKDNCYIKE